MADHDDFGSVPDILRGLSGRFLMSLNDRPEIREIFRVFDIEAVTTTCSIAGGGRSCSKVGDVIISGESAG